MNYTFRALCTELADRLQRAITSSKADRFYGEDRDAIDRARAALAEGDGVARPIPVVETGVADSIVDDTGKPWHQTMSGALWAKAFVAMHGGDEELMLSWFCNSIMAGVDHTYWANEKAMRPIPVAERLPAEVIEQAWKQYSKTPTFNDEEVVSLEGFRAAVADILAAAIPMPEASP